MTSEKTAQAILPLKSRALKTLPRAPVAKTRSQGKARWVGLEISHRRLFDALQSGWLLPRASQGGHLLAEHAFLREPDDAAGAFPIRLRVKLDVAKLPELDVLLPRENHWEDRFRGGADGAISFWPGALPTFAISELAVATEEERVRLNSLADSFSNTELPARPIVAASSACVEPVAFLTKQPSKGGIPESMNAIQGAMCMAVWAVPRMAPWLNLLVAGLGGDEELRTAADKVDARWFSLGLWTQNANPVGSDANTSQDRLWRAATDAFAAATVGASSLALAEAMVEAARKCEETTAWLESTRRILRAESTIELDQWRRWPVGIAIQLVLARPAPEKFKTWPRDMPGLPPAIWWAAAILCGLLTGYRNLGRKFRGSAALQESLAVHAFRTCGGDKAISWPSVSGKPCWSNQGDQFVLMWGERELARLPAQNRSKWLNADLSSPEVTLAAKRVAKRLAWPCLGRRIVLRKACRLMIDPVDIRVEGDALNVFRPTEIKFPQDVSNSDVVIEDSLDVERFRHLLVIGPGRLSEPPPAVRSNDQAGYSGSEIRGNDRVAETKTATLQSGRSIQEDVLNIPGLVYMTDFLGKNEENRILRNIDQSPWSEELQRRVQHYGWRYDYNSRQIDPSMHLGALPSWARELGLRLVQLGLLVEKPDQVIVNEYRNNQGITLHTDARSFADGIATISLIESWEMNFWCGRDKRILRLERRSALIMHGDARYKWKHEIPKRKTEPNLPGVNPRRVRRHRRLSLTFRRVRR